MAAPDSKATDDEPQDAKPAAYSRRSKGAAWTALIGVPLIVGWLIGGHHGDSCSDTAARAGFSSLICR